SVRPPVRFVPIGRPPLETIHSRPTSVNQPPPRSLAALPKGHEQRRDTMRQELFDKVKNGRNNPWVMDAELLSMLADDPECVTNVTSLQFSMSDLSDSRFKRTRDFRQLQGIAFYDCRNTDNVLESINGMPTILTVSFAATGYSDDGIRWLATLPNLKQIVFERVLPSDEIGFLRKLLPDVELVSLSGVGGNEQWIHDKPASDGETSHHSASPVDPPGQFAEPRP
ncbi:MAG: hypothetical protein ACYC3X_31630, partial [Pirellulaceae bacterium]